MSNPLGSIDWNATDSKPSGERRVFPNIPDGKGYVAIIKAISIEDNGKGPYIQTDLYFPAYNAQERDFQNINEKAMNIVKHKLSVLGFKGMDPDFIAANLNKKVGTKLVVEKKTNGKYRNYYWSSPKEDEVPF